MNRADARELITRVLRMSRATETEVTLGGGRMAVTRFANNAIHQNVEETWPHVSVRVGLRHGKRWQTGRASTTLLETTNLRAAVDNATVAARLAQPDPEYVPMAWPEEAGAWQGDVSRARDAATADSGPALRAHLAAAVVLPCRRQGLSAAGQVTVVDGSIGSYGAPGIIAIGNSRGLFQFYDSTSVEMSCTVQHASGATGWAAASSHTISDIDAAALGARAIAKATAGASPVELPAGRYTVLLEPDAVADLLWFLMPQFARQTFDEGRSVVGDKLGELVFHPRLSIADDVYHPLHLARPFDGEGMPTQQVELVRIGIPKGFVYSRKTARRHEVAPTGHGPSQPSGAPASVRAPVVSGGSGSLDALIAGTERALLVTRLWYNRFVDFRAARVTGMTRDGVFLIEGGRVVSAVRNMRYNVSVVELLGHIDAMGQEVRAGGMVVPPMRITDFELTGATTF